MEQLPCYLVYDWYLIQTSPATFKAVHKDLEWSPEFNWEHLLIPDTHTSEWEESNPNEWSSPEAFKAWYDYWKAVSKTAFKDWDDPWKSTLNITEKLCTGIPHKN